MLLDEDYCRLEALIHGASALCSVAVFMQTGHNPAIERIKSRTISHRKECKWSTEK